MFCFQPNRNSCLTSRGASFGTLGIRQDPGMNGNEFGPFPSSWLSIAGLPCQPRVQRHGKSETSKLLDVAQKAIDAVEKLCSMITRNSCSFPLLSRISRNI